MLCYSNGTDKNGTLITPALRNAPTSFGIFTEVTDG